MVMFWKLQCKVWWASCSGPAWLLRLWILGLVPSGASVVLLLKEADSTRVTWTIASSEQISWPPTVALGPDQDGYPSVDSQSSAVKARLRSSVEALKPEARDYKGRGVEKLQDLLQTHFICLRLGHLQTA